MKLLYVEPDGTEVWDTGDGLFIRAKKTMGYPVECCRCGRTYDLQKVEVISRYTDCTVWKTPCCRVVVNDGLFSNAYRSI